jgi:hypothetical protein
MNRWLIQILICVIALTMVLSVGFAQKVRTIPQLQIVSLDSLKKLDSLQGATGGKSLQASPYWGGADANADTVTVTGVVMVKPGVLTYTLARYNIYVQDTTTGAVWGGLNVLTNDTSAQAQASGIAALDTGMVITITGRILEFGSQNNSLTEMYHYSVSTPAYTSPPPISVVGAGNRPAAREISLSTLAAGTLPHPSTGEPYEGMYVIVRNVTVISVDYTSGRFTFQDSLGNVGYTYDGSQWYTLRGHKISSSRYTPPPVGTKLSYVRGIVLPQTRSGTCGDYTIMPLYPGPREQTNSKYAGDIGIASFSPQITSIARYPSPPKRTDAVTVTWKAKNQNTGGKIDSCYFSYRVGFGNPRWTKAKATVTSGDSLYSATIPAANADTMICYFVESWGGGVYGSAPDSSKPSFYQIRQAGLTIRDVQYTPFPGGLSGMLTDTVTVNGVIVADTTDIHQNLSGRATLWMASAAGAWNGIPIFSALSGVIPDTLVRGDSIQVTGIVTERGVSSNDSRTSLQVLSFSVVKRGVTVPAATTIGISGSGSVSYQDANRPLKGASPFEQWESVLVKVGVTSYVNMMNADNSASTGTSNFGEFFISTTKGFTTTAFGLRVNDDGTNNFYCDTTVAYQTSWRSAHPTSPAKNRLIPVGAAISSLTGIMTYSNGEYKLEPRKNDDFGTVTAITYQVANVVPTSFELSQNYPNPFNPSTTIRYLIPTGGKVSLKVYNLLGQVVETLVEQQQSAGSYVVVFNAARLSSGTYFYKLETDQYSVTKKMILLK